MFFENNKKLSFKIKSLYIKIYNHPPKINENIKVSISLNLILILSDFNIKKYKIKIPIKTKDKGVKIIKNIRKIMKNLMNLVAFILFIKNSIVNKKIKIENSILENLFVNLINKTGINDANNVDITAIFLFLIISSTIKNTIKTILEDIIIESNFAIISKLQKRPKNARI